MSLFFRDRIGIGVGQAEVSAILADSIRVRAVQFSGGSEGTGTHTLNPSALATSVNEAVREFAGPRRACHIVVTSSLAREWVMTAPAGLRSLRELKDLAAIRFQELYGELPTDWLITANWRALGPMLCGAIPKQVHEALVRSVLGCGLTATFTTFASACLDRVPPSRSRRWVCVRAPQSFIVALLDGLAPVQLRTLRAEAAASEGHPLAYVADEVERMALRLGIDVPRTFHYGTLAERAAQIERLEETALELTASPSLAKFELDSDVSLAACLGRCA